MAGHVRHFGGDGGLAKTFVQLLRERKAKPKQVAIHQLCMGGKRQGVPGNVSVEDALFHHFPLIGIGPFQEFIDQERSCGPNKTFRPARFTQLFRHAQGRRNVLFKVMVQHHRCVIGEANIEVGFKHNVDRLGHRTLAN